MVNYTEVYKGHTYRYLWRFWHMMMSYYSLQRVKPFLKLSKWISSISFCTWFVHTSDALYSYSNEQNCQKWRHRSFAYNRVTMDVEGVLVCFAPMQAVLTAGESFGELAVKSWSPLSVKRFNWEPPHVAAAEKPVWFILEVEDGLKARLVASIFLVPITCLCLLDNFSNASLNTGILKLYTNGLTKELARCKTLTVHITYGWKHVWQKSLPM